MSTDDIKESSISGGKSFEFASNNPNQTLEIKNNTEKSVAEPSSLQPQPPEPKIIAEDQAEPSFDKIIIIDDEPGIEP